ncbi:acyl-CoA dehydrogenase [Leptospira sp. GIMC2001]|nr:acyl-CoA dehydrogenase [Leptospira sp. GIMC2001]WCL48811.1 acyl-CoA dehydrogenase [Leptospira sp. GIMC2001]
MKAEDHAATWPQDFIDFIGESKFLSKFLTPTQYGNDGCRYDIARNTQMSEILGFYSLSHWYPWQVSILGTGPIWMSKNDKVKKRAADALASGGVSAFGLSEKEHGADLISTDMKLMDNGNGKYTAKGKKFYIGNGNIASILSVFGKVNGGREFVFFTASAKHPKFKLLQNVVFSQKYVAEFELDDYPIENDDILCRGRDAWDAALGTVAFAKFNLGLASTGIATHAFYEAVQHASNRKLYGNVVTDFPHIRQLLSEGYARLCAMRLFCYRAKDYLLTASATDRRYLLWTPMTKMKVTLQGEEVINLIWDVIAARGFEKDLYFESATRDIRMLPKLEGTAHVNMVLVIKFMESFLFGNEKVQNVPSSNNPSQQDFLFNQGSTTKGLETVPFGDWRRAYEGFNEPNVKLFIEQSETFVQMLKDAGPSPDQSKDLDFMLAVGELFTLIAYGSLILEQSKIDSIPSEIIDQIFEFQVKDFGKHALTLSQKNSTTENQVQYCHKLLKKPKIDSVRSEKIHQMFMKEGNSYQMNN